MKAAKQRKSRMKKLDKLGVMAAGEGRKFKASYDGEAEEIEEYEEDEEVVLNFPDPGGFDGNMVTLDRVSFGYDPARTLLEAVDLTIDMNSRVALLGRNGCGEYPAGCGYLSLINWNLKSQLAPFNAPSRQARVH